MGKHWQDLVRSRAKVENDVDGMSQRERERQRLGTGIGVALPKIVNLIQIMRKQTNPKQKTYH